MMIVVIGVIILYIAFVVAVANMFGHRHPAFVLATYVAGFIGYMLVLLFTP